MLLLTNYRNYVIYSPRKLTKERTYLIPTYICIWFDTLAFFLLFLEAAAGGALEKKMFLKISKN